MLSRREHERELENRIIGLEKEVEKLKQKVIDVELGLFASNPPKAYYIRG